MIEKILSILLDEDKAKGIHYLFVIEDGFSRLVVKNSGTIEIGGLFICQTGVKILIREGAVFSVADKVKFGHLSKVVCHKKISIGNDFRMSWECQIFDTDFHFVYNTEKNKYYPRLKPVIIGNDVTQMFQVTFL